MLASMALVAEFNAFALTLPDDWAEAQLELILAAGVDSRRAAALLAPGNPGRRGDRISFTVARHGRGLGPAATRRLLQGLDDEGIYGELRLLGVEEHPGETADERPSLAAEWSDALAQLPRDWSDLYAEARLDSTDYVELAALLLAPTNPAHFGKPNALRFRCARRFGYGVSPEMAERCLARCDEHGITGTVEILRVLSDTYPVATQGPVWYVGGRSV
jgi:hypothetical protein